MDPSTHRVPRYTEKTDQILRALSHPHRRYTLQVLHRHHEARLSEIAEEIARSEISEPGSDALQDDISEIRSRLDHHHVPTLIEAGLVHYMEERNVAVISEQGVPVAVYLGEISPLVADSDPDHVSMQLQQTYEYILNDQRPEAVGGAEELARELDVNLERPSRSAEQARQ